MSTITNTPEVKGLFLKGRPGLSPHNEQASGL
jgi:hypothetical protein